MPVQERRTHRSPYRRRPSDQPTGRSPLRTLTHAAFGGALVVGLFVGYGVWRSGSRFFDGVQTLLNPPPPEETVDERTVVVQQIRDASELTTAVFAMETVVPAESDRTFAGYTIGKTNLLYVAHGEVRAGIDLSQIQPSDITVVQGTGETALSVQLPPPQLLDSKIDVAQSRVYDYDRGFLNLGPDRAPELQELAQQSALERIEQAACEEGILTMASDRAALVVQQLLSGAGYERVSVELAAPAACAIVPQQAPNPQVQ